MKCFQQFLTIHEVCQFQTMEGARVGTASNSEIRRWFKQGSIHVNFKPVQADDEWPLFVKSIVLFPNKKRRCTLYYDDSVSLIQVEE